MYEAPRQRRGAFSCAPAHARIRALLEDLELILVQVTTLDGSRSPEELDLITDGLEQREVLPRLRTVIPAGTARQL